MRSGGSYLSQSDLRLHFGLRDKAMIDLLEIRWPSGIIQRFEGLDVNQIIAVQEGDPAWKRLK